MATVQIVAAVTTVKTGFYRAIAATYTIEFRSIAKPTEMQYPVSTLTKPNPRGWDRHQLKKPEQPTLVVSAIRALYENIGGNSTTKQSPTYEP